MKHRPRGGKVTISIPQIDIPHFVFGDDGGGIKRGPGKEGDVIGRDPQPGEGGAGDSEGEGIYITIDMEEVLKFMEEELQLPAMKPKPNETFEEERIKYIDISRVGLNSLRHVRRTMKEALKRLAMTLGLNKPVMIPGATVPMNMVTPIKSDFRYRQFKKIQIPSSNAVIFFARDCSGSIDDYRCDIVSDMCWWIDCWIRKFYKRVDRCYFVHDTRAQEVTEDQFYSYRLGGGTICSSAFETIAQQLENRYPPDAFNIYVFYFTDGDNSPNDNNKMINLIREKFGPQAVNLVGITQVCSWGYGDMVKEAVDVAIKDGRLNSDQVRTASIGDTTNSASSTWTISTTYGGAQLDEDSRNGQIIEAIKKLLKPVGKS